MQLLVKSKLVSLAASGGVLALCFLTFSCSKSTDSNEAGRTIDPTPNPNGVLLTGDPVGNAIDALTTLPPSPADESDIDTSGLILTRLEAVIAPSATVAQVNNVLETTGTRIVCMANGIPMVTLKTPKLDRRSSADSLAALLEENGAFAFAFASFAVRPGTMAGGDALANFNGKILPGGAASGNIEHLLALKMPAAWNVRDTVTTGQSLRVLVPDCYASLTKHVEIPSQEFIPAGNANDAVAAGIVQGNHGFHVCGVIGAVFDSVEATGVHPAAGKQLRIISMPISGYTFFDVAAGVPFQIGNRLPLGRFLLNTSLGYNDPTFAHFNKVHRALLMLVWRSLVGGKQSQFLHVTSAGNNGTTSGDGGTADFNSPWNSGAKFAEPKDMLAGVPLSPKKDSAFDATVANTYAAFPQAQGALTNVIIVGGNFTNGSAYPESSRNSNVRCVEELVYSACAETDPGFPPQLAMGCKGQDGWYTGTSFAAPQITGLAAYLWTLKPALSTSELKEIILAADLNNQVDAYVAVQGLDNGITSNSMRMRLLDIADQSDAEHADGQFTEHDVALFLQKFHEFEQQRGTPPYTPDYSRYDLNGDGITGDSILRGGPFDLDVNNPQSFGMATQTIRDSVEQFDETDLTDYDVLCFYGYSSLFSGNTDERDGLLPCGVADSTENPPVDLDLSGTWNGVVAWKCLLSGSQTGFGHVTGNAQVSHVGNQLVGDVDLQIWTTTCNSMTITGTFSGTVFPGIENQQGSFVGSYIKDFQMQCQTACGSSLIAVDSIPLMATNQSGFPEGFSEVIDVSFCIIGNGEIIGTTFGFSRVRP